MTFDGQFLKISRKIKTKSAKTTNFISRQCFILHHKEKSPAMKGLLLNKFYDAVQYGIGDILVYVFALLLAIEIIYVMAKYLGERTDK